MIYFKTNNLYQARNESLACSNQAPLEEGLLFVYDTNIDKGEVMGSSYHQLYFHFVWGTYRRHELIDEINENDLKRLINDKIIENKSELLRFGSTSDHVHLLVRLHPSISVSEVIGEIKGYFSYVLANQIYPESGFRWQGGFGALTISERDLSRLSNYIDKQKEHHENNTLLNKWELNG